MRIIKNHEDLWFSYENHENHANHRIPFDNHEDHENRKIYTRIIEIKKQIYGNDVLPMRFLHMSVYNTLLKKNGFSVVYNETIKKTYKSGKDYFMFIVIEAIKKWES